MIAMEAGPLANVTSSILSFGKGTHNSSRAVEFPVEMTWLWRDYDACKTEQIYKIEVAEKAKPPIVCQSPSGR
jgi:hypothetical protein